MRILEAKISLRFVLLGAMLGGVLLVLVSSATYNAVAKQNKVGTLGRLSLRIATFPTLVRAALIEAQDRISGREAYKYLSVPRPDVDLSTFVPVTSARGIADTGLVMRGDLLEAERGWRLFGGALLLDGEVQNAVALVSPEFEVRNIWRLNEEDISLSRRADQARKIIHGLALLPKHSMVVSFDHGSALQALDACGKRLWLREGLYHHTVSYDAETATLWTLREDQFPSPRDAQATVRAPMTGFVQLDAADGRIKREFTAGDIIAANPAIGLFDVARHDNNLEATNSEALDGYWKSDPFHFNDVEPLSVSLADAFPQFNPGDLLISARSLNAVFVLDPETLKIKWYRVGATLRQHDPDWQADGTISIYNNRMSRGPSRIVSIDPETMDSEVRFDGAAVGFYSRIRGRHSRSSRGDLVIASPQQGRAFEVGLDGEIVMEFYNLGPEGTGLNLALTEFLWVPEDTFLPMEVICETL